MRQAAGGREVSERSVSLAQSELSGRSHPGEGAARLETGSGCTGGREAIASPELEEAPVVAAGAEHIRFLSRGHASRIADEHHGGESVGHRVQAGV